MQQWLEHHAERNHQRRVKPGNEAASATLRAMRRFGEGQNVDCTAIHNGQGTTETGGDD